MCIEQNRCAWNIIQKIPFKIQVRNQNLSWELARPIFVKANFFCIKDNRNWLIFSNTALTPDARVVLCFFSRINLYFTNWKFRFDILLNVKNWKFGVILKPLYFWIDYLLRMWDMAFSDFSGPRTFQWYITCRRSSAVVWK